MHATTYTPTPARTTPPHTHQPTTHTMHNKRCHLLIREQYGGLAHHFHRHRLVVRRHVGSFTASVAAFVLQTWSNDNNNSKEISRLTVTNRHHLHTHTHANTTINWWHPHTTCLFCFWTLVVFTFWYILESLLLLLLLLLRLLRLLSRLSFGTYCCMFGLWALWCI